VSLSKSVIGLTITMARITGAMGIDGSGYQDIGRGVITTRFGSTGNTFVATEFFLFFLERAGAKARRVFLSRDLTLGLKA
jgi:hypothetical protein